MQIKSVNNYNKDKGKELHGRQKIPHNLHTTTTTNILLPDFLFIIYFFKVNQGRQLNQAKSCK